MKGDPGRWVREAAMWALSAVEKSPWSYMTEDEADQALERILKGSNL